MLESARSAVLGTPGRVEFALGRSVVVIVVDGLGAENLAARPGYARTLSRAVAAQGSSARIVGGFPSTTVAQLTSLATGVLPGEHGLVGYSLADPVSDRVFNLISGWGDGVEPESWQPVPTIFERLAEAGVPTFAFGPPAYEGSAFSRAFLRGAEYRAVVDMGQRLEDALATAEKSTCVVYAYVSDLDVAGHRYGWLSDQWAEALEQVDSALGAALRLRRRSTVCVTADHGMVDVTRHVYLDEFPGFAAHVRAVAGEPRCPQLYLRDPDKAPEFAAAINAWLPSGAAVAVVKDVVVDSGWLGKVTADARARLGDVLVPCLDQKTAIYDRTTGKQASLKMIGQHGSFNAQELYVPLVVFSG